MTKKKKVILLISITLIAIIILNFIWGICEGMISNAEYDIKVLVSSATSTEAQITIECTGPYDSYGLSRWWIMEKKTLVGWKKVEFIEGGGSGINAYEGNSSPIGEGKTYNFTYNWARDYGELGRGIYRLRWNIDKYDRADCVEEDVGNCYVTFAIWN